MNVLGESIPFNERVDWMDKMVMCVLNTFTGFKAEQVCCVTVARWQDKAQQRIQSMCTTVCVGVYSLFMNK